MSNLRIQKKRLKAEIESLKRQLSLKRKVFDIAHTTIVPVELTVETAVYKPYAEEMEGNGDVIALLSRKLADSDKLHKYLEANMTKQEVFDNVVYKSYLKLIPPTRKE